MSSNQTFWCPECDMSVHLLSSAATSDPFPPLCPHCHSQNLQLMDDPTPTPTTDINTSFLDSPSFRRFFLPFFGDFSPSDDDDDDDDSLYDSILPTIRITCSLLDDDPEEQLICAVCKEQFVLDVEAKLLPCDHLFHPQCILPWLNSNHNSCPLCRFQLPAASNLDVSTSQSSSSSSHISFSQLRESRASIDCTENFTNVGLEVGFTHQDGLDCGFPDVGALSSFLPSHF